MKFTLTTELDRPRHEVWRAFDSVENLKKWQPTLVEYEPLTGTPGRPGATAKLTYRENNRWIHLTETITERRDQEEFAGTYDSGHGTNAITNRFRDLGGNRTEWEMVAEFKSRGLLMWLMTPVIKGVIRKRLHDDAARFKRKLEAGELTG
jgi:uncharacterized membrane protein